MRPAFLHQLPGMFHNGKFYQHYVLRHTHALGAIYRRAIPGQEYLFTFNGIGFGKLIKEQLPHLRQAQLEALATCQMGGSIHQTITGNQGQQLLLRIPFGDSHASEGRL